MGYRVQVIKVQNTGIPDTTFCPKGIREVRIFFVRSNFFFWGIGVQIQGTGYGKSGQNPGKKEINNFNIFYFIILILKITKKVAFFYYFYYNI